MKFGYYPGCSLHGTASEYGDSFKEVCKKLDIELIEITDWVCCGTTPSHTTSKLLTTSLPLYNLILAEKDGLDTILVPCSSCYSRFKTAIKNYNDDKKIQAEVKDVLSQESMNQIKIKHPLEIFSEVGLLGRIGEKVTKNLNGLKVACYYGCLLTRPPEVTGFDSTEYPMTMDRILTKIGAENLDWSYKTDCCGGAFSLIDF